MQMNAVCFCTILKMSMDKFCPCSPNNFLSPTALGKVHLFNNPQIFHSLNLQIITNMPPRWG